jgi:hypothetical protein
MAERNYWLALFGELEAASTAMRHRPEPAPSSEPKWVLKLQFDLMNQFAPKLQLRPGLKPTPARIGTAIGCLLANFAETKAQLSLPKGVREAGYAAIAGAVGAYDLRAAEGGVQSHLPDLEAKIKAVLLRVLDERPPLEAAEFFKGLGRGLETARRSLVPQMVNGAPSFTPEQFERIRTMTIYWVTLLHWHAIDALESSTAAFDFLARLLPAEILGFDPERTRKMFQRFGKKFKGPGAPAK